MASAIDKGVTIRPSSTANLMLDSKDRSSGTAWNFQIQRNQSILNGFFTRIATSEVVLEWFLPNGAYWEQYPIEVSYGATTVTITPNAESSYTVEGMLDLIVSEVNAAVGGAAVVEISLTDAPGAVVLRSIDGTTNVEVTAGLLQAALGFAAGVPAPSLYVSNPDLRPVRYLDFVSTQLTYNQELKDASTKTFVRDVLCRWYMAWDTPPQYDNYGFPILMGYTPFTARRIYNPPKQIKWDTQQVIGNITFQVYTDTDVLVDAWFAGLGAENTPSNWLMTLQISEN